MNPSPDRDGDPGVWSYLDSATLSHDPSTYSLLPNFSPDWFGTIPGVGSWYDPASTFGVGYTLTIGMNGSGMEQLAWGQNVWPSGTIEVHPDTARLVVIGWQSPVTGTVAITGGVTDANTTCGNGIAWFIAAGAVDLASGVIDNGGAQMFDAGTGATALDAVAVTPGESLYFIVDPRAGDDVCDATQLDVTISCL